MAGVSRLMQAIRNPDTSQPFDRLVRFNWQGQFAVTFAGMLASFLIAGFWWPYWRIADMDFFVVYNAFLLNAHLPQEYFSHPGYLPILLLSYWLRALHGVGVIKVYSFSQVPSFHDLAAFGAAWMPATQAGRVLSLIYALAFVAAFSYLLRALVRDWRIACLGGFLLAFSGGMEMEMRVMRTELLAAGLFTTALLMLLVAARQGPRPWRPAVIGLVSALITLGMLSKVQLIFLICALPVLLLPFGPDTSEKSALRRGFWDSLRRSWPALAISVAIALLAVYLARNLLILGFADVGATGLPLSPLGVDARTYWAAVAIWIGLGMAAYGIVWRTAALETLTAMFAAIAGCMIGLLGLYACYNPNNVIVVFHPLETMLAYGAGSDPRLASTTFFSATRLEFLLDAIGGIVARRTFFLSSSARPTIFLEWFVIAGIIIAIRRREWHLVLCVGALMLTDWAVDTLDMGRHLQLPYFLFTDPLAIIAAALLIAKLTDLQVHRWTYPLGFALIAAHVVVSQAEPVKHLFRKDSPAVLCTMGYAPFYQRLGPFPYCPPQPAQP
jgi:hypothetical protein